jgi:hypothetical protein
MAVASGGSTSRLSSASSWTFVDANSGLTFAGTGVSLYRTTDGGNRWVLVKQFLGEQTTGGLSFVSATVGCVITARHSADGKSPHRCVLVRLPGDKARSAAVRLTFRRFAMATSAPS